MFIKKHEGKQFVRIQLEKGFDWLKEASPMLPGNPEWCPATHFGFLEKGEMGVIFKDGTEKTVKEGEAYLIPPGHRPKIEKDAVMVEFSQDPTYTAVVEGQAVVPPAPEPVPDTYFCTPVGDEGTPTKQLENAKMFVNKHEGRQLMCICLKPGFDWKKEASPMLPGAPDWCPATHFGYLKQGEMGITFEDGTQKTVKAGESYLVGPGHRPGEIHKDTIMVEFSQDPTWSKAAES